MRTNWALDLQHCSSNMPRALLGKAAPAEMVPFDPILAIPHTKAPKSENHATASYLREAH